MINTKLLKNKNFWGLLLIIAISLLLRIIGINKQEGLWYDEAVIYTQATQNSLFQIINSCLQNDVHFPAYQIILHFWIKLFGNNDITIRLFSVLCSILTVIVGFFAGKELKDNKTGLICASLLGINSFLIYYSQEVKFYSLIAFLALLGIYLILRIKNYGHLKDYIFLLLTNSLLLYTFTIAFIFVFFQSLIFLIYTIISRKDLVKKYLITLFGLIISFLPIGIYALINIKRYLATVDVFYYDKSFIFILLQNWFSPILTGLMNNLKNYFPPVNIFTIILILIPIILFLISITKALTQKDFVRIIFLFSFMFVLSEFILSEYTGFCLISRYTIMGLPLIILVAAYGIRNFKKAGVLILSFLFFINLSYILLISTSAPKINRTGGYKIPADIINKYNPENKSIIILPIRTDLFDKYLKCNCKELSFLKIIAEDFLNEKDQNNSYDKIKNYLKNPYPKNLENYIFQNIIKTIPKGEYLFLVSDQNFNIYTEDILHKIVNNSQAYYSQPLLFMKLTKITNDTEKICKKYMRHIDSIYTESWKVSVFKKY